MPPIMVGLRYRFAVRKHPLGKAVFESRVLSGLLEKLRLEPSAMKLPRLSISSPRWQGSPERKPPLIE